MLKSLFSGISGLQSHQVAMDVESNNIANVNTVGFKYSRANFSDLLAQVNQIATAPQGDMGGKNATQVGLGVTVSSMTRIFSQGSVQNTDKNTDLAIQGDGFFIVSSDGGDTLKYTRSGDFKFDSEGNFVDNNGFIVQGWLRDEATGKVDNSGPIEPIIIPPGLTTPARASTQVVVKANLNSGSKTEFYSSAFQIDEDGKTTDKYGNLYGEDPTSTPPVYKSENMNVMFNDKGEAFDLRVDQGVWISTKNATLTSGAITHTDTAGDEMSITFELTDGTTKKVTVNQNSYDALVGDPNQDTQVRVLLQNAINSATNETGVEAAISGDTIVLTNKNDMDGDYLKNIKISAISNVTFANTSSTTAYKYSFDDTSSNTIPDSAKKFTTVNDLRASIQNQLRFDQARDLVYSTSYNDTAGLPAVKAAAAAADVATFLAWVDGVDPAITAYTNPEKAAEALLNTTDNGAGLTTALADGTAQTAIEDIVVTVDETGSFVVENKNESGLNLKSTLAITGFFPDEQTESYNNVRFTETMQALSGNLSSTSNLVSQAMNASTHSSSIDVFDSLGSTHTVTVNFRKTEFSTTAGSRWETVITVPEPATITGAVNPPTNNLIEGYVRFASDGSFAGQSPQYISFSANNGSKGEQKINLEFGTNGGFDGMTSFTSPSTTSGIQQDGYTGGDLQGIRIDQSGTLIGAFSNGRSFGLAQVSMAKFANNEGLLTDGGNIYLQSANSGEPIRGTAASGGRGFIQSSALEASNVDLSSNISNNSHI
jgi:flagellar hook protein FlgE